MPRTLTCPSVVCRGPVYYRVENDHSLHRLVYDAAGQLVNGATHWPSLAGLVFIGLCNLAGQTTTFRRADWAYRLPYHQAERLLPRLVRWLTARRGADA